MKKILSKALLQSVTLLTVLACLATQSMATTAIMLTDKDLITSSRVILLGDIQSVKAQMDEFEDINTYVEVQVSEVLKGQLDSSLIVCFQATWRHCW